MELKKYLKYQLMPELGNLSEEELCEYIKKYPSKFQYIKNPSKKLCLAAISTKGDLINYIKNPSYDIKLAAVRNSPMAILSIEPQTEEQWYTMLIMILRNESINYYVPSRNIQKNFVFKY